MERAVKMNVKERFFGAFIILVIFSVIGFVLATDTTISDTLVNTTGNLTAANLNASTAVYTDLLDELTSSIGVKINTNASVGGILDLQDNNIIGLGNIMITPGQGGSILADTVINLKFDNDSSGTSTDGVYILSGGGQYYLNITEAGPKADNLSVDTLYELTSGNGIVISNNASFGGVLDMKVNTIINIGNANTYFNSSGALIMGDTLNLNQNNLVGVRRIDNAFNALSLNITNQWDDSNGQINFRTNEGGTIVTQVSIGNNGNLDLNTNNISNIGELEVDGISGDGTGKIVCIKSDGYLGSCTNSSSTSGVCACS